MNVAIGRVQSIEGKFFAKIGSEIIQLKVGDSIVEGMIVFGDDSNPPSARIEVSLDNQSEVIALTGHDAQLFDSSMAAVFENGSSIAKETVVGLLDSNIYSDKDEKENAKNNDDSAILENTEAGQEAPKTQDGREADFLARDNSSVDVTTNLHNSPFGYEQNAILNDSGLLPELTPATELTSVQLSLTGLSNIDEGLSATYTLNLDQIALADMTINLSISNITTNGDIVVKNIQLTIPEGEDHIDFSIANLDDAIKENPEQYIVQITGYDDGGFNIVNVENNEVITTISDESVYDPTNPDSLDIGATVSITGAQSVVEGDTAVYTVHTDTVSNKDIVVTISTVNVTTSDGDFTPVQTQVIIPAGQSSVDFGIDTILDSLNEPTESFEVTITAATSDEFEAVEIDSSVETVVTEITPSADAPTLANPDTNIIAEDTTANGNVLSNDSDADTTLSVASFKVDGDTSTYTPGATISINGVGNILINADGSYSFTPLLNYHGTVPTITYTTNTGVSDTLDISVTAVTDAMVDANESVTTNEDTAKTGNVMDNLTDADSSSHSVTTFTVAGDTTTYNAGQTATITGVGTITIAANGDYTFTPATNYHGTVPTVTYAMVDNNDSSDTDTSTLDISVTAVNDAPEALAYAITMNEDTTHTYTLADFGYTDVDGDAIASIRIDSLPVMGDLYYNGVQVSSTGLEVDAANIGLLTYIPDANDSGSDEYIDNIGNSTSIGEQSASYATFDYSVNDGTTWSNSAATMTIDVNAVADAPLLDVAASTTTNQSITIDTVNVTTLGYQVKALDENGNDATISLHTSPDGFGVAGDVNGGSARGDTTEISYDTTLGTAEQIVVTFDEDVSSVDVSLAWNASTENAEIAFYKNGVLIETVQTGGGTDAIDNIGTLQPSTGDAFDEIRFYPPGVDDDFLIHSITYDRVVTSHVLSVSEGDDVSLNITPTLTDTDGSESLAVSITDIPAGATLSDGTNSFTADAATTSVDVTGWNLSTITFNMPNVDAASIDYTLNVVATSTEYSNSDTASTTVPLTITVNDASYVSLQDNSASVDEAAMADGTDSASTAEIATGNILSNDQIGSNYSLSNISISGGTTDTSVSGQITVTTADGNTLVVNSDSSSANYGDYTYTLVNPVDHYSVATTGATITLSQDTFTDVSNWSGDIAASSGTMMINGSGGTATQTFSFGGEYAGQTVTIAFDAAANNRWDGGSDNLIVTADGTTVYDQSFYANQTDSASFSVTLDNNGDATIVITNSSSRTNEDMYIDNFTVTGPELSVTTLDTVTDSFTYTVSDGTTDYQANLDVTIQDDVPIVNNSANVSISLPESVNTNMVLTLDVSGSMNTDVNGSTRFEIAKTALIDTITEYAKSGDINVNFTMFNGTAVNVSNGWFTSTEAINYINNLSMNGSSIEYNGSPISGLDTSVMTNYEAAVSVTDDTYYTNTPTADRTVAYFLSDGAPTAEIDDGVAEESGYLDSSYLTAWNSFINTNNIDLEVVGIGTNLDQTYLDEVQVNTGKASIVVSDVSTLSSTLVATVDSVDGSLFGDNGNTGVSFGADGGHVLELTYNGTTYSYDASNPTQDINLSEGTMALDFENGTFVYTPTTSSGVDITETFDLSVKDADGDVASNTLDLLIGIDTTYTYDGATSIDAGAGSDTILLANGVNIDSLDFSKLDNIEKINLTDNGDHAVNNLTLNDVLDMTDSNNTLNITGDAADSVNSVDTTGWTQSSKTDDGTSTTYEYTKDGASDSLTLVVQDDINHTGM